MTKKSTPTIALTVVSILALGGCGAMSTQYESPDVTVPARWSQPTPDSVNTARSPLSEWWAGFNDNTLNGLVDEALQKNNDLAAATIRVRRAQLQAGLAEEKLTPRLSASGNIDLDRQLRTERRTSRSASITAGASWEIDLWNKLGSEADAARWEALATEEDRQATAQTLVATVANLYWQIAYFNERVALSNESVAYAEQTLTLVQARYNAGSTSPLEVAEARQSLESQRAAHLSLLQQRVEQRNSLAILFNGPPSIAKPEKTRLPTGKIPGVDADLPASLLDRRPDMKAAELRLRSKLSGIDATRSSYYPTFALTSSLGSASSILVDVLRNPIATLGAGITLPFLQWSEMRMEIAVSETEYEEAVIDFRQTLYSAMKDVEDALSARAYYAQQEASRRRALVAARQAEQLYEARYRTGSVALQNWLDAQEKRRAAQVSLAENRLDQLNAFTALCQALGGAPRLD